MQADKPRPRLVNCPQCGRPLAWSADNPYRPFCSERCKLIDLGAWATERYRIAADGDPDSEADVGSSSDNPG